MARNTKLRLPVMMSDATDPYQPLEKEYKITRRCAEVLARYGFPLLIVTKSDLVVRDIDVFKRTPTVVAFTVTTINEDVASLIEPFAPPPERRLSALQEIVDSGLVAIARIDPILPTVNDDKEDFEKLVSTLASIGVKQVTVATMKPVKGFFSTLKTTRPQLYERLIRLYADGSWIVGYKYLPMEWRRMIIKKFRPIVLRYGLAFASCREGLSTLNTTYCDGTAYCRNLLETYLHKG